MHNCLYRFKVSTCDFTISKAICGFAQSQTSQEHNEQDTFKAALNLLGIFFFLLGFTFLFFLLGRQKGHKASENGRSISSI